MMFSLVAEVKLILFAATTESISAWLSPPGAMRGKKHNKIKNTTIKAK